MTCPDVEADVPRVHIDVEVADRHAMIGPREGFRDKRADLRIPRRDGIVDADLDQFVVMGELDAAVVDRGIPRDEELDQLRLMVGVKPEVVSLEVRDEGLESLAGAIRWRGFGHTPTIRPSGAGRKAVCVS